EPGGGRDGEEEHPGDDRGRPLRGADSDHDDDHGQPGHDHDYVHVDDADQRRSHDADTVSTVRVAVLGGGRSSEHEVSLASAGSVRSGLEEAGYVPIAIEVGRDGVWRRDGTIIAV